MKQIGELMSNEKTSKFKSQSKLNHFRVFKSLRKDILHAKNSFTVKNSFRI